MYYKTKKSESKQVPEDSHTVPLEPAKNQHKESITSTPPDKNKNEDFAGEKPKDAGLSEKFFLSDFPED
ncbi:MAG: hypothetical protein JRD43_04050 [Deltaproteobacteria bacterium]|nr:hypothetical protein [Deltaproteobacteria bacterium]MBW2650065.1 hypothetical protein [Deltaproteobacteria bacterium]